MPEAEKEGFWKKYAGADVWLWTYKDKDYVRVELEDLYQRFKERLISELSVRSGGHYAGSLEDKS